MHAHPKLVSTAEELAKVAQTLSTQQMISLDTEFIRETTFFPIIGLIQVATENESWLIDPLALKGAEMQPLLDVFSNPKVLKILHAAQADQECIYTTYGVVATPSFDTAAAASLLGFGDSAGLARLVREVLGKNLPKGHARTNWLVRPLQDQLMRYAHQDVEYLIPLARKLIEKLEARKRKDWAFELSAKFENRANYEPNPVALTARMARSGRLDRRGYAALRELVAWREKRVREVDVPRRRIADDDVLVALASARPRDLQHTAAFRGLTKGELRISGEAILAAIQKANAIPEGELPEVPRGEVAEPHETRAIELIQVFVKTLAANHAIAPRYLVTGDDILKILRGNFKSVGELIAADILTVSSAELIGEELVEMIQGRRSLSIRGTEVIVSQSP